MGIYRRNRSYQGSITVYLSLILFLVLSMIMVIIEGARQTTARIFAERAFVTSMDSVLAGFYGPLMEEYHLLGLDGSYGDIEINEDEITSRMNDYMSYTFEPKQGLSGAKNRSQLYGISLEEIQVKSKTKLMDYQGELFVHEIIEYMKYRELGNIAEIILDKASMLEEGQKVSILYDEKLKLEEELVVIDEGILALMKYIDGLSTGKKGIVLNKDGSLRVESKFVKKILYGPPTIDKTGINNELIFKSIKNQYVDPSIRFSAIEKDFIRIKEINELIVKQEENRHEINNKLEKANENLQELDQALAKVEKGDKAGKEAIKKSIKEAKKEISNLEDEEKNCGKNIRSYKKDIDSCISSIHSNASHIITLIKECKSQVNKAVLELEQIIKTAKDFKPLINSYEETLNKEKEGLSEDIYENLIKDLEELKKYELESEKGYDFLLMKEILERDYDLLETCISLLEKANKELELKDFISSKETYMNANNKLLSYETTGLNIDYSSLLIQDEKTPDFLDNVKELIDKGIVSLIIDPDTISDKKLELEGLPSSLLGLDETKRSFSFSSMFSDLIIGANVSCDGGLFSSFDDLSLSSLLSDTANRMIEGILIQEYIDEHFYRFPLENEDPKANKPSVLTYEKEYLLCGKTSDKENLEAVIMRILLLRTVLNFTTILTDKGKLKEAKVIASALVGFTGLPILVSITRTILLITLAFVSSLVDICALLKGKELPILKKKIDLDFIDILQVSRGKIQKEASSYKDSRGFSYDDYVTLFLYVRRKEDLTYAMMDLAQVNINLRYGTKFNFNNCLFGYEAEASFRIRPLFTRFSFMQQYLTEKINQSLVVRAEYSY
ncbi:MAG: hypothetical protein GX237_04565 [Clostridiales bacterium]|nr:hypothetical protein [Clostridiales bacterium]